MVSTPALKQLVELGIAFTEHQYAYEPHGGTRASSRALGVPEHQVIKTLVMEDDTGLPLVVLMHGDMEVDEKSLARAIGCKKTRPCKPETATKHSGYLVGGTSPFGMKKKLPIFAEESIFLLDSILINGGRRGTLVCLASTDLQSALAPTLVRVGVLKSTE